MITEVGAFSSPGIPPNARQQTAVRRDAGEARGGAPQRRARSPLVVDSGGRVLGGRSSGWFVGTFHTTDKSMAEAKQWGAYLITYGGVSFTIRVPER
jgi:hypothetical protein